MFKIHVNDGTQPLPEDDIYYIIAKEGIFLKKKMGIMESLAPVGNISILESIQSSAQMYIKKIPGGQFARVIAFFREVYKEYFGEAIVLLFYDEERKVYKIIPPNQKVTSAACDYNKGITIDGMQMIGTIHSHANFSAFHSGVDDKDEEHFDGLHITIGNVKDEEVSITASIVANGHRFTVDPMDYVDRLKLTKDVDEFEKKPLRRVYRYINGKMQEDTEATKKYSYTQRKYDKRYVVEVSDKYHRLIPSWMEVVEKGTYQYSGRRYGYGYGYGAYGGFGWDDDGWGENYDSNLWGQTGRNIRSQRALPAPAGKKDPLKVGPSATTKPIEFPDHGIEFIGEDEDFFPCATCVFRGLKFMAEVAGEDDDAEVYQCTECQQIIIDDTEADTELICPVCKTNEHLILLEDDDLPSHYQRDGEVTFDDDDGYVQDSNFVKCESCGYNFYRLPHETKCPICHYSFINNPDQGLSGEEEIENQQRSDSGEFLADTEEINRMALEEARREKQTINKIPEPNQSAIPIPERVETSPAPKAPDSLLKTMFKHVFGGRGQDG